MYVCLEMNMYVYVRIYIQKLRNTFNAKKTII